MNERVFITFHYNITELIFTLIMMEYIWRALPFYSWYIFVLNILSIVQHGFLYMHNLTSKGKWSNFLFHFNYTHVVYSSRFTPFIWMTVYRHTIKRKGNNWYLNTLLWWLKKWMKWKKRGGMKHIGTQCTCIEWTWGKEKNRILRKRTGNEKKNQNPKK